MESSISADGWTASCARLWEAAVNQLGEGELRATREKAMPFRRATKEEHERQGITIREAAVLWLIFPDGSGDWRGVLMERTPYEGVHGGQVAIPGGEREPEDASFLATAMREFNEEMGAAIAPGAVIGRLHPLYIPPSRFSVEPYVAVVPKEPLWRPDPIEVAAVLRPKLDMLSNPDALKPRKVMVRRGVQHDMPAYDVDGRAVWGATALMLTEFVAIWKEVVRSGGWPDLAS